MGLYGNFAGTVLIRATVFVSILFVTSSETSRNRAAAILKLSASVF